MNSTDLRDTRVLVLEDDFYLATDIEDALREAGATVVGPFSEPGTAIEAITLERPDCALVDLNLGGGISFELPRALVQASLPFAFVTGYDRTAIPKEFGSVERAEKPILAHKAAELVARLLDA